MHHFHYLKLKLMIYYSKVIGMKEHETTNVEDEYESSNEEPQLL